MFPVLPAAEMATCNNPCSHSVASISRRAGHWRNEPALSVSNRPAKYIQQAVQPTCLSPCPSCKQQVVDGIIDSPPIMLRPAGPLPGKHCSCQGSGSCRCRVRAVRRSRSSRFGTRGIHLRQHHRGEELEASSSWIVTVIAKLFRRKAGTSRPQCPHLRRSCCNPARPTSSDEPKVERRRGRLLHVLDIWRRQ